MSEQESSARAEAPSEDDARRRLIQRIEQWDGETEYDAEDIAALADDILHEFNGAPVIARAEAQDEGAAGETEALALDQLANAAEVVRRLLHKTKEVQGPAFREAGISFTTAIDHARAVLRQRDAHLAHPSPTPAADADADADRVRIAVEALETTKNRVREWPIDDQETCMCGSPVSGHGMGDGHSPVSQGDHAISMIVEAIDEALAALKSTAAKEGETP